MGSPYKRPKINGFPCSYFNMYTRVGTFPDRESKGVYEREVTHMVNFQALTLPETKKSHLKMDGWKTSFLLGRPSGRCYVSFRKCKFVS